MSLTISAFSESMYNLSAPAGRAEKSSAEAIFNFDPAKGSVSAADKKRYRANRAAAMKSGRLKKLPATKGFWIFWKAKPPRYAYKPTGRETLYEIKQKLGIKDGAIRKYEPLYKDDSYTPPSDWYIEFDVAETY